MKKGNGVFALGVLMMGAMIVAPGVSSASMPDNFGFENELTGWSVVENGGSARAVQIFKDGETSAQVTFKPVEGASFLLLDNAPKNNRVTVSRTFDLDASEELSGSYAFYAPSWSCDIAAVAIQKSGESDYLMDVSDTHMANALFGLGWHQWSWVAKDSGTYTLSYILHSFSDGPQSYAMFDGASVVTPNVAPVPIPGAALLLGSGLMGMFGVGSRKNRKRLG
jgi:hypothetical protein